MIFGGVVHLGGKWKPVKGFFKIFNFKACFGLLKSRNSKTVWEDIVTKYINFRCFSFHSCSFWSLDYKKWNVQNYSFFNFVLYKDLWIFNFSTTFGHLCEKKFESWLLNRFLVAFQLQFLTSDSIFLQPELLALDCILPNSKIMIL